MSEMKLTAKTDRKSQHVSNFFTAAEKGEVDTIKKLINELDDISDIDLSNAVGKTPLIIATCNHHVEVAKILFGEGADPDKKDMGNRSAREYAQYFRNEELINLFEN